MPGASESAREAALAAREAALEAHRQAEEARAQEVAQRLQERAGEVLEGMVPKSILPELFPSVEWEVTAVDAYGIDAVLTPLPERDFVLGIRQERAVHNEGWIGPKTADEAVTYPEASRGLCDCQRKGRQEDGRLIYDGSHKHRHDHPRVSCAACGCDGFTWTTIEVGELVENADRDQSWSGTTVWSLEQIGEWLARPAPEEDEDELREDDEHGDPD